MYQSGKVYKIINSQTDDVYVGSTYLTLAERMIQHYKDSKKGNGSKLHHLMNQIGFEHFTIVLLEAYPCGNKEELVKREEFYRQQLQPTLNILRCHADIAHGLTREEYKKQYKTIHKQKCSEYNKKYRLENKDKVQEYNKAHREKINAYNQEILTCECGKEITRRHMARHRRTTIHAKLMEKNTSQGCSRPGLTLAYNYVYF